MKNIIKLTSPLFAVFVLTTLVSSCKKKTDNEEELITTVRLTFTHPVTSAVKTYEWKDLDGDGGNAPVAADTISLDSGVIYTVSLNLLNQSGGANEDITEEVKNEAKDHLVCYSPTGSATLEIVRTDSDGTYPIGLQTTWKAKGKGKGIARVQLKHQPGVKNGDCDPGDTDVDVNFDWIVK